MRLLLISKMSTTVLYNTLFELYAHHMQSYVAMLMWKNMMKLQIGSLLSSKRSTGSNESGRFGHVGLRQLKLIENR